MTALPQSASPKITNWNVTGFGLDWSLSKFSFETNLSGATLNTSTKERSVIICDPVSIFHLTGDKTSATKIDELIAKKRPNKLLLEPEIFQYLSNTLDSKIIDIMRFILDGGILIFFLRESLSFSTKNDSITQLDNYSWLQEMRPNKITPNMENSIQYHNSEKLKFTASGHKSELRDYLKSISPTSINSIEKSKICPDYEPLCFIGKSNIVSAQMEIGGNGGAFIFIPPPSNLSEAKTLERCLINMTNPANITSVEKRNEDLNLLSAYLGQSGEIPLEKLRNLQKVLSDLPNENKPTNIPKPIESPDSEKLALQYEDLLDMLIYHDATKICQRLKELFTNVGWNVINSEHYPCEIYVGIPGGDFVIVRVAPDDLEIVLRDLGKLAQATIASWGENMPEPRALLVGTTRDFYTMASLNARAKSFDINGFAARNNIQLRNITQLAGLLKKCLSGELSQEEICLLLIYENDYEDILSEND